MMRTMLIIVAIAVVLIVLIIVFVLSKMSVVDAKANVADIPAIFEKLRATNKDANFAAFAFVPPGGKSADDTVNVQFSIEEGRIGFDWVLLAPGNIRDKDRFVRLAESLNYKVISHEMNNVKYLRVEDGNLPDLCTASICDLYGISPNAELDLIPQGFTWP